ncbi:WASH complex subunit 5 [Sitophilus oryzae]|uniref:WASH complex subunit 5 n=1 Tax=Sitophilus oryzae TaxID=7048 RepID=A0A6J2X2B4_SITOR|nr:WASH complex subunit 5 [Sitophilus oryzae]
MKEFVAENNICGQTILLLVSRGNAIIAELLRLKDYVPKVFKLENKEDVQKYGQIIFDFAYFKTSDVLEDQIESNENLRDLDEEFRDNHLEILKRFYLLFESIHSYIIDLNKYIEELETGFYLNYSLDIVFLDIEGKQLLCEGLFLYGLMLLLMDSSIEGCVRERLLVSYYRYTSQRKNTKSSFDEVCKLLRDTGFTATKKPMNYPEDYFKRIPIKIDYIELVIGRLRADDIYSQITYYPLPKHRSTALSTQASMLYISLFFASPILHSQAATMREIVDKFFSDNWIISVYMGHLVNLIESWDNFKAAKLALNNTLDISNIKMCASNYGTNVQELLKTTGNLLKEGTITRDTFLKDTNSIINTLRESNATIRWLILHTRNEHLDRSKKVKQYRDLTIAESNCEQSNIFKLLLNTAQLELVSKELFQKVLNDKSKRWESFKQDSCESLSELSEVFGGTKPLSKIKKNENLEAWFKEIAKQVESLNEEDSNSSRKLVQLIQALEEVQEYHQLDNNLQVVQCLIDIRNNLHLMIKTMNIKEDVLINLQIIGDISYAWELIDVYTPIMQNGIKKEPKLVTKLRAVFLKLASAMEFPLIRINQAHSEDLISVSEYYSRELEIYIRKVLQIIPKSMFQKLGRIIEIQRSVLKEIPASIEKEKLKEYAQLEERFEFAELTHLASIFSQGMLMMKSTLVGVVRLDAKKLLEDGIRKELVQYISEALHSELKFETKSKLNLKEKLKLLGCTMEGYKKSFEYIQDYINVNGLKIWQEEVTRIINYNVEQECNSFLRNKTHFWQSAFQSRYVPIPSFPSTDESVNFIGRLSREIIKLTDPRSAVYLKETSTWYDIKHHKPIFNKVTVDSISQVIEIAGLVGLDRLFSFMITTALQKIVLLLEMKDKQNNSWLNVMTTIKSDLKNSNISDMQNPLKTYQVYINRATKIWAEFLDKLLLIGQLQLLRNLINLCLNNSCRFNANDLLSALRCLDKALMIQIKEDDKHPSEGFLFKISEYFNYAGLGAPLDKIYVTSKSELDHSIALFIFVLAHVNKMFLPQISGQYRKNDQIDGVAVSVGIHTIVKQFHTNVNKEFIKLICEYIIQLIKFNKLKNNETGLEVTLMLNFMNCYTDYSECSRKFFREYLPDEILYTYTQ